MATLYDKFKEYWYSTEDLLQIAVEHGRFSERMIRRQIRGLEAFCAKYPIGMCDLLYFITVLSRQGVRFGTAAKTVKKIAKYQAECEILNTDCPEYYANLHAYIERQLVKRGYKPCA